MNYDEVIKDLTSQGKFYINLGLERISELLKLLGNPQNSLKCIQVAGTNGKGSVCSMLASILKEAGYNIGLYTSPHIFDYTERIKINENQIPKGDFIQYYELIIKTAQKHNIHLTEFEILTGIMFKYFYDNKVEYAIIETGLGGRFDATNVLKENICAIITHIDLDHTDRLGDTKEKIAFEKAGIIKPNSFIITSEGYEVIKDKADELNSAFILTAPFVPPIYAEALSLKGVHQQENLALVLTAVKTLFREISEETILKGLKNTQNPCRFQYIKEKNLLVDGAHNPDCMRVLRENIDIYFPNTKKQYIFGCLNTKDYKKMIEYIEMDSYISNLYFYQFKNVNSMKYDDLKKVCKNEPKELKTPNDIEYSDNILTVICGSFYMINELIDKKELGL